MPAFPFLPRPKRPITGPNGIQVAFNWQSSGKNGPCLRLGRTFTPASVTAN